MAAGAFGAHALREQISPELLVVFETGIRYQMYHALALIGVAGLVQLLPSERLLVKSGWLFVLGIVLFTGSLSSLSLTGLRWWGMITPFGGLAFLIGWSCLFYSVYKAGVNSENPAK